MYELGRAADPNLEQSMLHEMFQRAVCLNRISSTVMSATQVSATVAEMTFDWFEKHLRGLTLLYQSWKKVKPMIFTVEARGSRQTRIRVLGKVRYTYSSFG